MKNKMPKYLQKEYNKLPLEMQVHTKQVLEICFDLEKYSKKKLDRELLYPLVVLHDVKNNEENHSEKGADYAFNLLKNKKSKKFAERVYRGILNHTEKPKTDNFTIACFYDADVLCRFYPLGVLRAWVNIKSDKKRDWRKLFEKISSPKTLDQYPKMMKKKLQLSESKKLLDDNLEDYYNTYKLLGRVLE